MQAAMKEKDRIFLVDDDELISSMLSRVLKSNEYDVRATCFVLGWVAERHAKLVRAIASRGHNIASHGYAHRLVYDQTPHAFAEDVRLAKRILEDASGRSVVGYRAPSYSITPRSLWALDGLLLEGYEYDASIFPI